MLPRACATPSPISGLTDAAARRARTSGRAGSPTPFPHQARNLAKSLVAIIDGRAELEPLISPLDSQVVVIGERSLSSVAAPSGPDEFAHEQQLISQRRKDEAQVFLPDAAPFGRRRSTRAGSRHSSGSC